MSDDYYYDGNDSLDLNIDGNPSGGNDISQSVLNTDSNAFAGNNVQISIDSGTVPVNTTNTFSKQFGNEVDNQSGAIWYDRTWREIKAANPDWTDQQVTDEMTRRINEADWNARYNKLMADIANSKSLAERDQLIREYRAELEAFRASGINVDNDLAYLRNTQGEADTQRGMLNQELNFALADAKPPKLQYNLPPGSTADIDSDLTSDDIANGYHLEPDEYGVYRRYHSSGIMHPDDLSKYFELENAINRAFFNHTVESIKVLENTLQVDKDFLVADTARAGGNTLGVTQGASNAGASLLGFNKLYASAGMSDMLPYSVEAGDPTASGDYFSMWRMAIFGHDNSELANNQFKKAVDDTIYKDIYPLMLDLGKVGVTVLAGRAGFGVAATGNFVLEAAKNKSENYDRSSYTWENALVDAGKKSGIDLAAGMGAKEMSQVIAAKFNLAEPARLGLEKGLDYLLKKGIDQIMEK